MEERGYKIIKTNIDGIKIGESLSKELCEMLFGYWEGMETTYLLTDHELRKKCLKNPKCVWKEGSTKSPIVSKSTGQANMYMNKETIYLRCEREIVEEFEKIYNSKNLVNSEIEPPYIKAYKSIKSSVTFQTNSKYKYKGLFNCFESNIIQIVPKFNLVRDLVKKYYGEKEVCLKNLDIREFSDYVFQETSSEFLADLKFESLVLKPGELLIYDPILPLLTLPNKNKTPSVYIPICLYPKSDIADSHLCFLKKQFTSNRYGNWFTNTKDNREEYSWRLENDRFTFKYDSFPSPLHSLFF